MKMTEPLGRVLNPDALLESSGLALATDSGTAKARNLRISLKQWKMFNAVIDFDGFFGAADSLHVTQSTISHAVAKLQEQLGVPLLELKGRKARITEEGKILLEKSRDLVRHAIELEELADGLRQGWGPEIRLAMDPSFPADLLTQALRSTSSSARAIRLRVKEATPEQATLALRDNTADLAISTRVAFGFAGSKLIDIEHVAVAHPKHALFGLKRELTPHDLRTHCQLVISDANDYFPAEVDGRFPVHARSRSVTGLERAMGLLRQGLGYAWLPRHQVQDSVEAGLLRILPIASGFIHRTPLYLNAGRPLSADCAARGFADALHACSERFVGRWQ
jgi:DNA-binding transcriptional LysR family regulator